MQTRRGPRTKHDRALCMANEHGVRLVDDPDRVWVMAPKGHSFRKHHRDKIIVWKTKTSGTRVVTRKESLVWAEVIQIIEQLRRCSCHQCEQRHSNEGKKNNEQ